MEKVLIKAKKREVTGKKVRALRRAGKLPAVIYGNKIENPISIELDAHEAFKTLRSAGSSTLLTIELDGTEYPTLIREKQMDFIKNIPIHIDFVALSLTEKTTAQVSIYLEGESPAVREFGATLVTGVTELEVECLPTNLPENFTVDVSGVAEIGAGIYVKDIEAPDGVEILTDPEEMVVVATAVAVEEEPEVEEGELLEGEEMEEPEVIEKGKKEEEEESEE
ncbi:MAG: 50S ribosomal protein L25 [Anaerolineales bacterium]